MSATGPEEVYDKVSENKELCNFMSSFTGLFWRKPAPGPIQSQVRAPPRLIKNTSSLSEPVINYGSIRRCTLIDVAFWDTLVHQASVNKRGWVLQERLMAPRILHFCKDQIASECREFDAAETRPRGISNFQLHFDNIVSENRLKGLDPEVDGKRLRLQRLQAAKEPDKHLVPGIYTFELWARIVEVYSNTAIINSNDKLIALAGVAKWMSGFMKSDYVAGLWREHLASQLLWRVVSVFQSHNRSFSNPSQRPSLYRAPTFSWASVDADNGSGIIYGEVTDQDLFIEIAGVHVTTTNPENPFGLIKDAHLKIWGKLRKIDLFEKINEKGELNGRYGWRLHGMGEDVDKEEHTNVYLDCPEQDGGLAVEGHDRDDRSRRGGIFDSNDIWCIPAAEGERAATRESRYLICLLLQEVKGRRLGPGTFRRIGLSKLSPWGE